MLQRSGRRPALPAPSPLVLVAPEHTVEVVQDLDGLTALRAEWDEAFSPQNSEPWETFGWVNSLAHSRTDQRLRIITVRANGRLTGVASLALKRSEQPLAPWRIDCIGGEDLKEPNRIALRDRGALEPIVDILASERTYPVRMSRIPHDDGTAAYLISRFKSDGWITRTMSLPYPYLDLRGTGLRKSLREDLRRARRRAEKLGGLRSELVEVASDRDLLLHLQTAFRIEASGWKGRNGTAILRNPARQRFFEQYGRAALENGTLRLRFLSIGSQVAAMQYGIESGNSYWLLNIGYDETFGECSPGNLLLADSVASAADLGLSRYNFLGKHEPWIQRWTSDSQDCTVIAAYRPNPHGIKAMVSDALYLYYINRKKAERVRTARQKSASRHGHIGKHGS